jgi:cold shock CspA family protein
MTGTVIKFDRINRWGFAAPDDLTLPDHFIHASDIVGPKSQRFVCIGQKIEFDSVGMDIDRPQAKNIRKYPFTIAIQRSTPAPEPGGQS